MNTTSSSIKRKNRLMFFSIDFSTWLILFFLNLSFPTVNSDPRLSLMGKTLCGMDQATTESFIPLFVQAMEKLLINLSNSNNNFAVTSLTNPNLPPFYALAQCHQDLSRTDCFVCYAASRNDLATCVPSTWGLVFLDGCFLRYDNYSFFQEAVNAAIDYKHCSLSPSWPSFVEGGSEFDRRVANLVGNLTQSALLNNGFGVMEMNGIYGLAQCWESLNQSQCRVCLNKAKLEVVRCFEGSIMNAGCFFRYSKHKFFNDPHADVEPGTKGHALKLIIGISCGISGIMLILFLILCRKKIFSETQAALRSETIKNHQVEIFIKNFGSMSPKRYTYSEIKKITNTFREKLGQGGYGSVYRGQLPDGQLVAVKLLGKPMGDGEDFINEVASIGRTSHVNIVTLLGFCFEGKKRALMYEFMPNGSLDKFLRDDGSHLDWNTLFRIAKGIARGLEYLHEHCNTRIVHFDIKPHNILLDEEFIPKISDFGLAKLSKRKQNIVSVTGARGTAGYMAPEVFFKSFGGASHKSDVYSYGMMVFEMTGVRKKKSSNTTSTSEAYFPDWIYKHVEGGENLGVDGVTTEEEEQLVRKMVIVSLWCIQSDPSDRPSITNVVEMLEGSLESLKVPPKRFWSPRKRPTHDTSSSATKNSSSERVLMQPAGEYLSS
ncbi:unnamed protein product [Lactuca virosa]|uniref:Protein kinase domain-containing protein n=1 Tax=Lactuca virosa TaxID=75947 RepID=A0AAU9N6G4_9ASTR|nr:unnamed protein product [Lactuca virosa]